MKGRCGDQREGKNRLRNLEKGFVLEKGVHITYNSTCKPEGSCSSQ